MAILNNSNAISSGGYDINNSLRFRSSASAYLNRTPASAGNRRTWTWSAWVKRGSLGARQTVFAASLDGNNENWLSFQSDDTLNLYNYESSIQYTITSSQVFRDPSAWYHIVVAFDTPQATAANRIKIYINGSQVTAFSTATYPSQNFDGRINNTVAHALGRSSSAFPNYFDGYLADVNFIDGSAKTPSDFGETDTTTGSWKPKAYTGTYGTNGFYLKFSDIATTSGSNAGLGKDFSGNANYWTTNSISVTAGVTYDAMTDSPTLTSATVANYAVLNPLNITTSSANTEANLKFTNNAGSAWKATSGTFAVTSGKYYWEVVYASTTSGYAMTGVLNPNNYFISGKTEANYWSSSSSYSYYGNSGNVFTGDVGSSYGNTYTNGDIIGVALDMDNGKIYFSKNGTWQNSGNPATGTNPAYSSISSPLSPAVSTLENGANAIINFGQRPFSYTPPTGFVALNTFNLPDSTIKKGNTVMDATTYTGTGVTSRQVTNAAGFKPDFVWVKARSATYNHTLYDSIRGVHNYLISNLTNAEGTSSDTLQAFNSNGFTVGTNQGLNENASTYVGWQWQAGQGSTSSNTSGSITSTVSVNTTAGFSIVTYTGTGSNATVGHGLGVAPKMIITRYRGSESWSVYHTSLGGTKTLYLNLTNAANTTSLAWNNTDPTSTVFSLGSAGTTNTSGSPGMVAYCWAAIAGYSAFGSWTGNGSTDGPMIYLGFQPKFIMWKRTDSSTGGEWVIQDTTRKTYNPIDTSLYPNLSNAEGTNETFRVQDTLSNGFKIRASAAQCNASGGTYIYAAFASNPFRNSNAF